MRHTFSFLSSQATWICSAVLLLGLLVGCDAFGLENLFGETAAAGDCVGLVQPGDWYVDFPS